MTDDDRAQRFVASDDEVVITPPPDEQPEDTNGEAPARSEPMQDGATEAEAAAYWQDYDGLQADIREAWLIGYMGRAWDSLKEHLALDMSDEQVRAALTGLNDELTAAWVGTADQPGALYKLALAGMVAGDRALDSGNVAKPHRAVAVGVDWNLLSTQALDFAKQYSFDMITNINQTTVDLVRGIITQGITDGLSLDKVAARMGDVFHDEARARVISATESLRAYNHGAVQRWKNADIQEALFQSVRDRLVCPLCRPLQGTRAVISQGWPARDGNHTVPPMHVGCRCFMKPIVPGASQ